MPADDSDGVTDRLRSPATTPLGEVGSPGEGSSARPTRVLIVDADRRVRQSLQGLLALAPDVDVVGVAGDVMSALDVAGSTQPDVCLLDPRLPEVDAGLALLARLHERWPDLCVVAMSCSDAVEDPALASGATAFLAKQDRAETIVDQIRQIARDGRVSRPRRGDAY